MQRSGAPEDTGIRVAVKDRANALKNPYAHIRDPNLSFDAIAASPMLWDPIRLHETCPSSDGACALVLTSATDENDKLQIQSRIAQAAYFAGDFAKAVTLLAPKPRRSGAITRCVAESGSICPLHIE